jgi:hypothetical protein
VSTICKKQGKTSRLLPRPSPRYLNPFEGRKKPIQLSGLFLFDPDVFTRLIGQSTRKIFIEMGQESLFKGLERACRTGKVTKSLRDRFIALLPPTMGKAMADAFDIPGSSTHEFSKMGPWEAYLFGAMHDQSGTSTFRPTSAQFIYDVEHASRRAATLYDDGQCRAAADYLASHSLLQRFLSPELSHGLAQSLHPNDFLVLRIVVALEVWLSLLALWDVEARAGDADDTGSYIGQLLTLDKKLTKNSAAQLFDWLLQKANVSTPTKLINDPRLRSFSIQVGTLGAWSRGENFPSDSYRSAIASALLGAEDAATFKILSSAARQLNFLGYVAQYVEEVTGRLEGASAAHAKQLGLGLPFSHETIEVWMQSRYPVWLRFHRAKHLKAIAETMEASPTADGATQL